VIEISAQVDAVISALRDLGGIGHLSEIERQCAKNGSPQPAPSIRRVVELHSAHPDRPAPEHDLFYSVYGVDAREGFWGLRHFSAQLPDQYPVAALDRAYTTLLSREQTPLFNVRGIAYRDGIVHAIQVGFAPGSTYPDELLSDGRILHIGEGKGHEQDETSGNAGMLDALARGYAIPVYQATGPRGEKRYAPLGDYQVVSYDRRTVRIEGNDFDTNAFVFTLEPVARAAARAFVQEAVLAPGGPASLVDDGEKDEPPDESSIPDQAPKAPTAGEYASDPEARRQALERRNISHHALVLAVKSHAASAGLRVSRTRYADALVRTPAFGAIFEMKSIRDDKGDLTRQVRAAIAQLYHYRFLHRKTKGFEHGVHLYAVFNAAVPAELVGFLREIGNRVNLEDERQI
jgi:hypothetical protein